MSTLIKRSLSGLVFIIVMVAGLLVHPLGYAVLMTCFVGIMVIEFYRMTVKEENKTGQVLGFLSALLLFLTTYVAARYGIGPSRYLMLLLILSVTATWVSVLYHKSESAYRTGAFLSLPLLYIVFPFSTFNFLVFNSSGIFQGTCLLGLFIILWASDVGGYVIGMTFGQKNGHKLFPRISPKKSWEGFVGSVLFSLAAGYVLHVTGFFHFAWYHCLVLAVIICVAGVFGDLFESELKRYAGVKDSGRIMPGHGGLLDRFDGALLAFPLAVFYILFVVLIP